MQARGEKTMGVDHTMSSHGFQSLPDGGRIVLVRDVKDSAGVAHIRAHLRDMQHAFGAGDFSMPMFIHMKTVPGVSVMADRHNLITYTESDLPNGGALRIVTDPTRPPSEPFTSSSRFSGPSTTRAALPESSCGGECSRSQRGAWQWHGTRETWRG